MVFCIAILRYPWVSRFNPAQFAPASGARVCLSCPTLGAIRLVCNACHCYGGLFMSAASLPEECSSMARAPVSKTGGWGFESLHSCQA